MHIHRNTLECLELVPLFASLPLEQRQAIADLIVQQPYSKGSTIYLAGDEVSRFLIVEHGQIKITQSSAAGNEQIVRVLNAGEFDGEANLFGRTERDTSATVLTDALVCQINRADFQRLLHQIPEVAVSLLNQMSQKIAQLEKQVTLTNTVDVKGRLAQYLVETSAALHQESFSLPLLKKDIATYLGTTAETVSRTFKELVHEQLITNKGRQVTILDADGLALLI